jgi:hypothetical protein
MLSYNKDKFTLVITATEEQKKEALLDFDKMTTKLNNMFKYLENKDTPQAEKDKFEPLAVEFMRTITAAVNVLVAMGVNESDVKKYLKFQ